MASLHSKLMKLAEVCASLAIRNEDVVGVSASRWESEVFLYPKAFIRVGRALGINSKKVEVRISGEGQLHCNFTRASVRFVCVISEEEAQGTPLEAAFTSLATVDAAPKLRAYGPKLCLPAPQVTP